MSDRKIWEWQVLDVSGIAPVPRFNHSMNINEDMRIILIYGGQDDAIKIGCH